MKQGAPKISEEEDTGCMGDHNNDSVLHILSDLAKGENEMKETFAKGINTLTQLLSPLQGVISNGGNG